MASRVYIRGTVQTGDVPPRLIPLARRPFARAGALLVCSSVIACSGAIDSPGGPSSGATGSGATAPTGGAGPSVGGAGGMSTGGSGGSATGGTGGSGGAGGAGGSAGTVDPACASAAPNAGSNVLRMLSSLEYQRTVQSLFRLSVPPPVDDLPADNERLGFRTFAEFQTMSPANLRAYLDKAGKLADDLLADTTRRTAVIGCALADAACLGSFVASFGRLAYRRALEPSEVDAIVADATTHGLDDEDRFRFAIEVLLSSPSFLYRVEVGDAPDALSTLGGTELASRLSFALLGRSPSGGLLDQAATGALDTPEGLRTAAQAMLADPEAQNFYAAFFRQWLGFNTLRPPVAPPQGWSDALLPELAAETDAVIRDHAWGGQSLLDMLTAPYTKVSASLATFYGLPAPGADGRVDVPSGHVRAGSGILTHASLLSAKTDGDLIAIRGHFIRRSFLCEELTPDAAVTDEIETVTEGLDRIEIINTRNELPQCAGCHASIDPIGIGFAKFDAAGRYDDSIDLTGINVTAALPDAPAPSTFTSIGELATKLKVLPVVPSCVADRAFLYVNGRMPAAADACTVASASEAFVSGGMTFPALIAGIVESPAFRLRRPPAPTP
jgi:hypothetical protein